MHIEVSTDNSIDGSEALTSHIANLVQRDLANMESHITRIEVHLSDANANKTGQDEMHCMLEARLEGLQPTVVKESAATVEQAAKGAAVKMKHALESIIGKRSDRR
ncbi:MULTISPECIES: HPF/RaiA family ribosome-associated protein [unclassified Marinovum]